jgi:hypothetical protein
LKGLVDTKHRDHQNLGFRVCVQGVGRAPQDCMPDSSSLSDQEAVLFAADSGIGQQ